MAHPGLGRHRVGMTRAWSGALGSLGPWLAFLLTILLADDSLYANGVVSMIVITLFFVAAPSMVPITVARSWGTRLAVTGVMTAVAVFAALRVVGIDDGQAGFALIYVPMVAFPLAGIVSACESAFDRSQAGQG